MINRTCAIAALALTAAAGSAHAALLDWGSGWTSADPDGSYQDGALTNSAVFSGIGVNVTFETFGTATGDHNFLPPSPGTSFAQYNGDQAAGDPALSIGDSDSFNGSSLDNFVRLSIDFSQAVDITDFSIGDIDISSGGSWQDAVVVLGSNAGSAVDATYALHAGASPAALTLTTFDFASGSAVYGPTPLSLPGALGLQQTANDLDDAQIDVGFTGVVDRIEILYWNGPDANDADFRGIYIQDIGFVPTPGATALGALALGVLARRRRA